MNVIIEKVQAQVDSGHLGEDVLKCILSYAEERDQDFNKPILKMALSAFTRGVKQFLADLPKGSDIPPKSSIPDGALEGGETGGPNTEGDHDKLGSGGDDDDGEEESELESGKKKKKTRSRTRSSSSSSSGSSSRSSSCSTTKTKIKPKKNNKSLPDCKFYRQGRCMRGSECLYKHRPICQPFLLNGNLENGCTRGRTCERVHVVHCPGSRKGHPCQIKACRYFYHVEQRHEGNPKNKADSTKDQARGSSRSNPSRGGQKNRTTFGGNNNNNSQRFDDFHTRKKGVRKDFREKGEPFLEGGASSTWEKRLSQMEEAMKRMELLLSNQALQTSIKMSQSQQQPWPMGPRTAIF